MLKGCGDVPVVAFAVAKAVLPLPVVLIGGRPKNLGAGSYCAFVVAVDVGDVNDDPA